MNGVVPRSTTAIPMLYTCVYCYWLVLEKKKKKGKTIFKFVQKKKEERKKRSIDANVNRIDCLQMGYKFSLFLFLTLYFFVLIFVSLGSFTVAEYVSIIIQNDYHNIHTIIINRMNPANPGFYTRTIVWTSNNNSHIKYASSSRYNNR